MFKWIKNTLTGNKKASKSEPVEPIVVDEEIVPKSKATSKPKASAKKKKVTVWVDDSEGFAKMTKLELDIYAREKGFKLDRRKTKAHMIKDLQMLINKQSKN